MFCSGKIRDLQLLSKCCEKVDLEKDDGIGKCGTMQLMYECNESIIAQLRAKGTNGEKLCLRKCDDTVLKMAKERKQKGAC